MGHSSTLGEFLSAGLSHHGESLCWHKSQLDCFWLIKAADRNSPSIGYPDVGGPGTVTQYSTAARSRTPTTLCNGNMTGEWMVDAGT